MKAVILERRGTEAAVLAENGTFLKVPCSGETGEEIDIAPNVTPVPGFRQRLMKGLAAAALVLVAAGGAYHYTAVSVSAYVSVDAGGSSLEMKVNRLGQIISVESVTDDGSALAETISGEVRGMSVEDAVEKALDTLAENGKLTGNSDPVIVGITSESDLGAKNIETAIAQNVELPVHTVRVSGAEREEAHRQELGGGQYVYDRAGTADALPDNAADEQDYDVIAVSDMTDKEENVNASDTEEKHEEEKVPGTTVQGPDNDAETRSEENNVQPAQTPMTVANSESAAPPELPDGTNTSGNVPQQDERTEPPAPGQEQRPQAPDTEMTGEMPQNEDAQPPELPSAKNGEAQPPEPPDGQNDQPGQPPELPNAQNGELPAPPDNAGQPPEQSDAAPPEGFPPNAGAAGQQAPDGQMPTMPAPMDGQQDMMPGR